nr:MAG TPA: hypothetical protein [Caudoviricetes sp.]
MPAQRGQLLPCVDRWQVLHQAQGQPGGVLILPTPSGWSPSTWLAWHTFGIILSSWHGGAEPLAAAAASLFGLSPDS